MYMANIGGWNPVQVFSEDKDIAKWKAVQVKKGFCEADLEEWTWEECEEYYGAYVVKIKDGLVLTD